MRLDRLVYVDEFGAVTNLQRTHGPAPPGERVVSFVPHGYWKLISTIAAMTTRGMIASAGFDGTTDTDTFVAFVTDALVPSLRPGDVAVMDNLAPNKAPAVRRAIESAGATLLLLPPYSPDIDPIEMAFSKVKAVLGLMAERTVAGLFDAIGTASALRSPASHPTTHAGTSGIAATGYDEMETALLLQLRIARLRLVSRRRPSAWSGRER